MYNMLQKIFSTLQERNDAFIDWPTDFFMINASIRLFAFALLLETDA